MTVSHGFETYLAGQPRRLAEHFDVTLVASPGPGLVGAADAEGVHSRPLPMERKISPLRDLRALVRLYRILRTDRPDIVQSYSPKAGLLTMIAAYVARVPVRVHGIIGMPLMEASGPRGLLLRWCEQFTYALATHVTCNSQNLRTWIGHHLSSRAIEVIGHGSVNGVDLDRLRPPTDDERRSARVSLGLAPDRCVFTFVGRLVEDKGIGELIAAFSSLPAGLATLLLVGDEEGEGLSAAVRTTIATHEHVVHIGWRGDVRPAYWATDVLVLPSYREGMPNVLLEAAATGLPLIASDINGCDEIIHPEVNGLLVPIKNSVALRRAMESLINPAIRQAMGKQSRQVVAEQYDHHAFCNELIARYRTMHQAAHQPGSATRPAIMGDQSDANTGKTGVAGCARSRWS